MGWIKNVFIGFLISFLILEILLRIVPTKYNDFGSTVRYQNDPEIGFVLAPNQKKVVHARSCYRNDMITTNALGFRDDDWVLDKKRPRIAILGDSCMEALQIPDDELLADLLEKEFKKKVEVMNFGISGYGTLQEYLVFKKYAQKYKPDLVLLFFLTGNDIMESSCNLSALGGGELTKACSYIEKGEVIIRRPSSRGESVEKFSFFSKIKIFLRNYCRTCLFLVRIRDDLTKRRLIGGIPLDWFVYMPPDDRIWEEAWEITEHFLVKLNEEVEESGGELIVFTVPDYLRVCPNWEGEVEKYLGKDVPEGFDPFYPVRKLRGIAERRNIQLIELEHFFITYRDRHHLRYPYFSFRCDGHWSDLGHRIAMAAIFPIIRKYFFNSGAEKEGDFKGLEGAMSLSNCVIERGLD